MFVNSTGGDLVDIDGVDPEWGEWRHKAYVPAPLPSTMPALGQNTFMAVAEARAALAALDSTARRLPNPTLLRLPTLRREAQSTSALEGTYAPLADVLIADDEAPGTADLVEILNYVHAANHGFDWMADGRPLTTGFIGDLQGILMRGTPLESESGRPRESQVVIGRREDADPTRAPIHNARFVPAPQGTVLQQGLQSLVGWMREDHAGSIDPVVAAAMSHYQFETLHPFRDGNGRIGRLLIVLHLQQAGVLSEPTLTVSPWFETRRSDYYARLLAVSTSGDWDAFVRFFSQGLQQAADSTQEEMLALVAVQTELREVVRDSKLRAETALSLVDLAVANPSFTVGKVQQDLGVSYGRANAMVGQLMELGVLDVVDATAYKRRFFAPRVLQVLTTRKGV